MEASRARSAAVIRRGFVVIAQSRSRSRGRDWRLGSLVVVELASGSIRSWRLDDWLDSIGDDHNAILAAISLTRLSGTLATIVISHGNTDALEGNSLGLLIQTVLLGQLQQQEW